MWDERNAEDTRLLAAGDHATLLATYYEIILGRCLARLRNEADAYEVAHRVIERLIGELSRGRTYTVPYSVVVSKVVDWKVVEFFSGERESTKARQRFDRTRSPGTVGLLRGRRPPRYETNAFRTVAADHRGPPCGVGTPLRFSDSAISSSAISFASIALIFIRQP